MTFNTPILSHTRLPFFSAVDNFYELCATKRVLCRVCVCVCVCVYVCVCVCVCVCVYLVFWDTCTRMFRVPVHVMNETRTRNMNESEKLS